MISERQKAFRRSGCGSGRELLGVQLHQVALAAARRGWNAE
jgi:hypothetical protein